MDKYSLLKHLLKFLPRSVPVSASNSILYIMASPHIYILVLGAGELGTAVLKALAAHPQHSLIAVSLRAATIHSSNPAKVASIHELEILGISTIAEDIASMAEQELANTFSSFDTLIGCTGTSHDAGTQLKIAHAVLVAKVRRYPPWQFGIDYDGIGRGSSQDLFTKQLDVRELLRQQKVTEWVIVSNRNVCECSVRAVFWSRKRGP